MELQHAFSEFSVCDNLTIFVKRQRTREASLDVDLGAIDTSEECSDHSSLVILATKVVVQDVRHDCGVDVIRQVLYVDTVI